MQWNGVRPNPDRPAPLRSLMEILQQKAEPYVTQYGENQLPGAGQLLNSIMRTGTEMVPGVGDLLGAEDLQTAAQNNDWAGIGLGALAAIPGIPAIGRGVRGEARAARGVANTVADAVPTNQPMTEAEAALARYRAVNPNDTGARVLSPGDQGYPTNAQWDEVSQAYVAPRSVEDLVARAEAMGAKLNISQGNNGLTLSRIVVPPSARSQGVGSRIMRDVERYADSAGLPVGLTPSGDFGGSVPRLNEFYRRFGFTPNTGRSRDFSTRETMLRQPREIAPVEPDYPIRAFHGSPHSFDRFSLDKIGTGEGAQAYGHGLYFAESEDVARQYRDTLSGKLDNPLDRRGVDSAWVAAARDFRDNGYNPAQIEEALGQIYRTAEPEQISAAVRMSDPGSMYEVGINADPNTFLDWDRPLSEQPESVMSALRNTLGGSGVDLPNGVVQLENGRWATAVDGVPIGRPQGWPNQSTAEQALRYANEDGQYLYGTAGSILQRQRNQPEISAALAAQGIPGIRYLDANSRGVGEGSRNYVLFNDELVKILRKYGISGLSTTVGASALAEELDRRGQTQEF